MNIRFAAALLMLTSATAGCSAIRSAMARDKYMKSAVMGHTYERPCGDVWAAARTLLFARDFQVKSADGAAGLTLETEWKTEGKGKEAKSSRYLFQGTAPTPDTCRVQATAAVKQGQGETDMERDWHMEWDLIKEVDAASAQRIESEAHAAGEEAKSKG